MNKQFCAYMLSAVLSVGFIACDSNNEPSGPNFDDLVERGWSRFSEKKYGEAIDEFRNARALEQDNAATYTGIGWAQLLQDSLSRANSEFNLGAGKPGVGADLFAGWAFSLNAIKNHFASNQKADSVIVYDVNWSFAYGLPLDINDIYILKAENYFILGDMVNSLTSVQFVNPDFSVDVTTHAGQAALAQEIERLRAAF
ncbi:MAG TPA: hypothetical protein ENJ29_05650 [Bacteroidetes bacterium]|nr:hypothetical protein [Bacteroidota bacterium]